MKYLKLTIYAGIDVSVVKKSETKTVTILIPTESIINITSNDEDYTIINYSNGSNAIEALVTENIEEIILQFQVQDRDWMMNDFGTDILELFKEKIGGRVNKQEDFDKPKTEA